ncbi:hypothetical protein D3C78_388820 [compost metagenome]
MFDHYYIIPRSGPFYAETVKLRLYPAGANVNNPAGGQPLEEGVHYNFGYHFAHASHTIGLPVYGAITFYDRNLAGQLRMEFQTIGGEWVLDDQKYAELLLNVAYNPRIGTWEQVVELPHQFPVVNHDFNIDDFVGMSEVVDELSDIEQAILQKNAGGLADHVADKSNPHDVTKTQVGLGLVDNFPTATVGEAQAGVLNTRFMTPLRVKQLIDATATAALNGHMADMNNPHQTTKTQVGLGNVQNYAVATQAEAEAGASNARYMTPLRTREAIEAIVGVNLTAHINDKNNPHQTTKAQVGLGSVVNIGIATDAAAVSGVDDSGVITPRLLAMVLSQTVGSGMTDHVQNFNNPHSTTKAQVGLGSVQNYAVASEAEARAATASDRYMTPLAVRHAINELVGDSSNAHATDYNNPHRVTADQVGTYSEQEIDQLLADKIGLDDTAGNSSRIFGLNQPELQAWIATISSGNSYKFEQKTYAEVKADILTGTAADSMKLDGKTYQEIRADITAAVDGSNSRFEVPPIPAVDVNGVFDEPPLNWLKIGTYKQPLDYAYGDMTLLITGGRNEDSETDCHHTVLLEMSLTNDYPDPGYPDFMPILVRNARVKHLSAPLTDPIVIGYVIHQQAVAPYIDFYIKSEGQRAGWTINEFSRGYFTPAEFTVPDDSDDLILVEPAGIVYPTAVSDYSTEITQSQTHIARTDNPHGTTKAQVGLGSVQNYGTATPAQGVTGTATNLYMTPASTTAKVDNSIGILCDELIVVIDDAMVNLFA